MKRISKSRAVPFQRFFSNNQHDYCNKVIFWLELGPLTVYRNRYLVTKATTVCVCVSVTPGVVNSM